MRRGRGPTLRHEKRKWEKNERERFGSLGRKIGQKSWKSGKTKSGGKPAKMGLNHIYAGKRMN